MVDNLKATLKRDYIIMLCHDFIKLSSSVWYFLEDARNVDYQIKEETITDFLMIFLKKNNKHMVKIKTFTRKEEKQNGSDWEWWFLDSSGKKGIGFRVQAKILNLKKNKFLQLYYKNQNQNLISEAKKAKIKLFPLYCLYTHKDDLLTDYYGCSIISAYSIKNLKLKNIEPTLDNLKSHMFPWHILVCDCQKTNIKMSLPNRIWKILKEENFFEENIRTDDLPNNGELPNYVKKMINKSDNYYIEDDEPHFEDLDGVMVIIDSEQHNLL
ncbi:DUF6615 family protein [uncultured Acinetobacter sp.]|uniref:DUF6615 family protein n=1 Tax=uncultured Acinetobacter sp. TaxID=165433 RepID=UPI00258964E3|nr:DUF6615 family protein [uncultured Acinetobacter sp.]